MIALRGGNSGAVMPPAAVAAGMVVLTTAVVADRGLKLALAVALVVTAVATFQRALVGWSTLVCSIVGIVLFVPMRRFALPGALPFQLDLYRVALIVVVLGWAASLLVDVRVKLRRSIVDGPLLVIFLVAALSIGVNYHTLGRGPGLSGAIKELTFLGAYLVFFWVFNSVIKGKRSLDTVVAFLVAGAALVALGAVVEFETHYNVFERLARKIPLLRETAPPLEQERGGHLRAVASSQHPIALGAMFAMAVPLALYLFHQTRRKVWLVTVAVFGMGAATTGSRTAIVMLLVVGAVYLALRPRETIRFWPALIPVVILVHFAMPGTIGGFYKLFFPKGGLVAEQANAAVGSSRVASLGPGLHLIGLDPLVGGGFGGRVFGAGDPSAFIVDDQWLSTGIDTGVFGIVSWIWLFVRFLRPTFRAARRERGPTGWFFMAVSASILSFAIGMLTFDAFSFIQTTFVMFVIVAIGCVGLRTLAPDPARAT